MADQDKKQEVTDRQTKAKQKLKGVVNLTTFCLKNQVIHEHQNNSFM